MVHWPLVAILVIAAGFILTDPAIESPVLEAEATMRLLYLGIIAIGLLLVAIGQVFFRGQWRLAHNAAVWSAVVVAIGACWLDRDDLKAHLAEIRGEVLHSVALSNAGAEEQLERAWDGHYRADTVVNGRTMTLMVDTGATMVVLPYEQVSTIGIDPTALDFHMPVMTANGKSTVAPITIREIRVGNIVVRDVQAAVAHPGRLQMGLLGMSFLDQLSETSFQGKKLFLRQGANDTRLVERLVDQ
ncbi:MAG: TIGR02281 family clan AA aspartic protease [Pseudomonadota bacterium]